MRLKICEGERTAKARQESDGKRVERKDKLVL